MKMTSSGSTPTCVQSSAVDDVQGPFQIGECQKGTTFAAKLCKYLLAGQSALVYMFGLVLPLVFMC